jgi:glycosyltransferase involved in cell wall biosynthesis
MAKFRAPFFSVIIPVYNRHESLGRAIRSVLAQSFSDFEIIVVDDGSNSSYSHLIQTLIFDLNDCRLSLLRYDDNRNGAYARNAGAKKASGSFLSFLDSDDEWEPNKLEVVATFFMSNQECHFLYHQYVNRWRFTELSRVIPDRGMLQSESFTEYSFIHNRHGGIQSSCITVSRRNFTMVEFDSRLRKHQDWDFVMRYFSSFKNLDFIPQPLTIRHINPLDANMVSKSLDYSYTYNFFKARLAFFNAKSALGFIINILMPLYYRERYFGSSRVLSVGLLYLGYLLRPLESYRIARNWGGIYARVRRLSRFCRNRRAKVIALFGFNNYTRYFLGSESHNFEKIFIIDNRIQGSFLAWEVMPLSFFNNEEMGFVEFFVTMTDKYQLEMENELRSLLGSHIEVINF